MQKIKEMSNKQLKEERSSLLWHIKNGGSYGTQEFRYLDEKSH